MLMTNWYDYPQYYDIAFQAYTKGEADFIEVACRKYCPFQVRRLLEPACGSGRLTSELVSRGYKLTGFDQNQSALRYLKRRLGRRGLGAEIFEADMSDFRVSKRVDAAYCTLNTFRELLTENLARRHLACVAESLRPGGIYILAFDLLQLEVHQQEVLQWTQRRAGIEVVTTLRVERAGADRRVEDLEVCMLVRRDSKESELRDKFQLRTYAPEQFQRLLRSVPALEVCDVYDFWYNIEQPVPAGSKTTYGVFVLRRL